MNIASCFQPDVLVGGFHLHDASLDRLDETARILAQSSTVCFTGHCTGLPQYAFLKTKLGDRLHALSTGGVFSI